MNSKDYRRQWAEGEIEASTLLDAIDELQYCVNELSQQCGVAISARDAISEELESLKAQRAEKIEPSSSMIHAGVKALIGGDECSMECLSASLLEMYEIDVVNAFMAMLEAYRKEQE